MQPVPYTAAAVLLPVISCWRWESRCGLLASSDLSGLGRGVPNPTAMTCRKREELFALPLTTFGQRQLPVVVRSLPAASRCRPTFWCCPSRCLGLIVAMTMPTNSVQAQCDAAGVIREQCVDVVSNAVHYLPRDLHVGEVALEYLGQSL